MLLNVDSSLLMAAGASFMVGLLGYIIARLWIKPIMGYHATKRQLGRELSGFLEQIEPAGQANRSEPEPQAQRLLKQARRHAMSLDSRFKADIPAWYRLLLVSRSQSPEKVLAMLAPLSKYKNVEQITTRIADVRKTMGLK